MLQAAGAFSSRRLDRQSVAHDLHHSRGCTCMSTAIGSGKSIPWKLRPRAMPAYFPAEPQRDPSHSAVSLAVAHGMRYRLPHPAPGGPTIHRPVFETTATTRTTDWKPARSRDVVSPVPGVKHWGGNDNLAALKPGPDLRKVQGRRAAFVRHAPLCWRARAGLLADVFRPSARRAVRRSRGPGGHPVTGGIGVGRVRTRNHVSAGFRKLDTGHLGPDSPHGRERSRVRAGECAALAAATSRTIARDRLLSLARPDRRNASGRHRPSPSQQSLKITEEPLSLRRGRQGECGHCPGAAPEHPAHAYQREDSRGILEHSIPSMIVFHLPRSRWLRCAARRRHPRAGGSSSRPVGETARRGGGRSKNGRGPRRSASAKLVLPPLCPCPVRSIHEPRFSHLIRVPHRVWSLGRNCGTLFDGGRRRCNRCAGAAPPMMLVSTTGKPSLAGFHQPSMRCPCVSLNRGVVERRRGRAAQ